MWRVCSWFKVLNEKERKQQIVEEELAMKRERAGSIVTLNLRGGLLKTY